MRMVGFFLFSLCLFAGCGEEKDHKGKTPLVEVSGEYLYREDMQAVLPPNQSKDDSLLFATHYIKDWVESVLLYHKAESNVPDNANIDELVENYRKALIMHSYQQKLIEQQLEGEITEKEISDYYEENKKLFIVEQPLVKGLFIKVPLLASGVNKVRSWYKRRTPEIIDKLEKYSLQNAVSYEYFYDKWVPLSEIIDKIPLKGSSPESYLDRNRQVEMKDTAFYYFLNIDDYLGAGQMKPLEFAQGEIKDMLINLKRVEFMRGVKEDLYKEAVDRDKIIYY